MSNVECLAGVLKTHLTVPVDNSAQPSFSTSSEEAMTENSKLSVHDAPTTAIWRVVSIALLVGFGSLALLNAAESDPKGLFLSEARDGVKFNVLLDRGGSERTVSTGYRFESGDRMRFQFEINRDSYVYFVHRQIDGDPTSAPVSQYAGLKGIRFVMNEQPARTRPAPRTSPRPARAQPTGPRVGTPVNYKLLFPSDGAGRQNKLVAKKSHTLPLSDGVHFEMDENPGIEKLYVVVSPTRLNKLEGLFTGDGAPVDQADASRRVTEILAQYSNNASVSIGKGIIVDSYGVGLDAEQPFMTEVDLVHY